MELHFKSESEVMELVLNGKEKFVSIKDTSLNVGDIRELKIKITSYAIFEKEGRFGNHNYTRCFEVFDGLEINLEEVYSKLNYSNFIIQKIGIQIWNEGKPFDLFLTVEIL